MTRKLPAKPWLPAVVAVLPLIMECVRTVVGRGQIFFWGDQALIDLEARDTVLGRNLLGVYDRYGWHHLGPVWLGVLGAARWVGGGSRLALVLGAYAVQAVAAAAIVLMVHRLRPGFAVWWAAVVVVAYEWSLGLDRLGTVWAPYAIALPAALLVLLVADLASNPNPWPATVGAVACGSFLCQTEISTIGLTGVLLVTAPLLRYATQGLGSSRKKRSAPKRRRARLAPAHWGWVTRGWPVGAASLGLVTALLWAAPVYQQLSDRPGNMSALYRFFTSHSAHQGLDRSLRALGTLFGSFPFGLGTQDGHYDADLTWLVAHSPWSRPWYLLYLALAALLIALAAASRQRQAFALATASGAAVLAGGLSVLLVYGPLYPYLIFWLGATVVPLWVAAWLVLAPAFRRAASRWALASRLRRAARSGRGLRAVASASFALAALVGAAFVTAPMPMAGHPAQLGRGAWDAVASAVLAPGVREVYIDVATTEAMPDAAAIADQAERRGRRVEVDAGALHYLDPSFSALLVPQLEVLVCCGKRAPSLAGMTWLARVGGQEIYVGRWVSVDGDNLAKSSQPTRARRPRLAVRPPVCLRPTPAAPARLLVRARHEV